MITEPVAESRNGTIWSAAGYRSRSVCCAGVRPVVGRQEKLFWDSAEMQLIWKSSDNLRTLVTQGVWPCVYAPLRTPDLTLYSTRRDGGSLRIFPAPPPIPSDNPPAAADRAQAALTANLLAELIGERETRLVTLQADTDRAMTVGAISVARATYAKSLQLRLELEQLKSMEVRLMCRFSKSAAL